AVADSGALYRSVSGGVAWTRTALGSRPLRDVVAWDWNIVVVGDSGKVWRSADLGVSWSPAVVSAGSGPTDLKRARYDRTFSTASLRRVAWLGGGTLIAVGSGGTVVQSTDGGATWSAKASGTTEQLNAVRFVDGQNGWMAGTNGFL